MKRIKVILSILIMAFPLYQSIYSQTQMLWSKSTSEENNFNQNQYECPIWLPNSEFFDYWETKLSNDWMGTHSVISKDFNNDGYCDVFIAFFTSEQEKVPFKLFLYNPLLGELEDNSSLIMNNIGQSFNRKSVSADFNGDGILDIVCVSHPENELMELSYLDIVMSNQTGWEQTTISTPSRFKNEGYHHGVTVGDIDNDGDIDFVVSQMHNENGMISYLNNGKGEFTTIFSILNDDPQISKSSDTVELFDINNDGCLDLIYHTNGDGERNGSRIAYGNCDGTFGDVFQNLNFGLFNNNYMDFDFVDFDKDGDNDLIVIETDYFSGWQLIFLENDGFDSNGKIIYNDLTNDITTDLKQQNFYLDESSKNWAPYIQIVDLNKDGIKDIIKSNLFDGDYSNNLYPQNWVLFGKENLKFKYVNYPILTPLSEIGFVKNNKEVEISWKTTLLPDNPNPFNTNVYPWSLENLRGEVTDWVIYYSQTPWGDKNIDGLKRVTFPNNEITKEFLGNNTYSYKIKLTPEFEGNNDIYFRITYVDSNGVENPLSPQIQFSVEDFDYDEDGIPNVTDICPNTPIGTTVDSSGCFSLPSNNFTIEVVSETCPNKNNGQIIIKSNEIHNYITTINGTEYNFNNNELIVDGLPPNTYDFCITVDGQNYKQCYTVEIDKGTTIEGKSSVTSNKISIEIIEGTSPYTILQNGSELFKTNSKSFSLDVEHGDLIEVKTDKVCEGIFSKVIELIDVISVYPNPTKGSFEIFLPISENEVSIELFTIDSRLISKNTYSVINGKVLLNLEDKPVGVYVMKIYLDIPITVKIVKE